MVAFTGFETKAMKNSRYSVNKNSFLERSAEIFSLFSIFIVFIFAVVIKNRASSLILRFHQVSTIVLIAKTKDLEFLQKFDEDISNTIHIFTYLILYSPMVPIAIYGTLDFLSIMEKFKLQRKYNRTGKLENSGKGKKKGKGKENKENKAVYSKIPEDYLRVNDPMSLSNLGHVDFVCIDKTGTLTKPSFTISKLYANEKIYKFQDDALKTLVVDYNEKSKTSLLKYHPNVNDLRLMQSPTLKINTMEDVPAQQESYNDLRYDEQIGDNTDFAKTRDFATMVKDNKLAERKLLESPDEKFPLNVPPTLPMSTNANTTTGVNEHEKSAKKLLDLRTSYIHPGSENLMEHETAFFRDLIKGETGISEFMKCLILCHGSRVVYEGVEKKYFESYRKEEETVLEFAKCCSYLFEKGNKYENPDQYSVLINNAKLNFDILGINEFSYQRRRFSIVVREAHEQNATLYCKGPLKSMREILEIDKEEMEALDSILKNFKDTGLKCVVYARKRIDHKDAENFQKNCHNLKFSLMSQTKELEELASTLENKMELLGVVGLKEEIRPEVPEMISFFDHLNIPVWLLSGDTEENVLNSAYTSNLIDSSKDLLAIKDENAEDLFLTIRNLLSEMKLVIDPYKKNVDEQIQEKVSPTKKRILKKMTTGIGSSRFAITLDVKELLWNKFIVVNGASFNLIMNDPYLKSHFIFLLAMPKVVIAYNLTPTQKQEFVKIIQNFFENKTVLAIGDGYNDNLMMQMADVSIEIVHLKSAVSDHIRNNAGDIQVNNLKNIKNLMLLDGKSFFERIDNMLLFLFYKEYLLAFPLFFFNWYASFTGTKLFTSIFVFLYQFIFSAASIVIYGIFDKPFQEAVMRTFPGLYLDGAHKKFNAITRFFIRGVAEAVVQSVLIFYFTAYMIGHSVNDEGKNSDYGILVAVMAASVLFIHNFKLCFMLSSRKVFISWVGWFMAVGLYICYIFANDRRVLEPMRFEVEYKEVFTRATSLISMAYQMWLSLLISFLFNRYVHIMGAPTISEYFQSRNEGKFWD